MHSMNGMNEMGKMHNAIKNRLTQLGYQPLKGTGILVTAKPKGIKCRTRLQSFQCAFQGLVDAWETQPNLRVQTAIAVVAIVLGVAVHLTAMEWLWISFAIGIVIFAELMNTAIEQTVDLVVGLSPDPLARKVKDIAASCVLVSAGLAVIVGAITFIPHLARLV